MDTEPRLPQEWNSLPLWVKDELLNGSRDLPFYSWHIQKLVDHGENMRAVWQLFDMHRELFTFNGPVHSLLCVLHQAALGLDPGLSRTDDDRQAISDAVQKHVDGLARQVERLGTGSAFGLYPLGIAHSPLPSSSTGSTPLTRASTRASCTQPRPINRTSITISVVGPGSTMHHLEEKQSWVANCRPWRWSWAAHEFITCSAM